MKEKSVLKSIFFAFSGCALATFIVLLIFVEPKFESITVIFPPNTNANIHLVGAGMRFGNDKEIGEQLEILASNSVRDALVKEFDLIVHYQIDTTENYWQSHLQNAYNRNINFERTINKSIEIVVRDTDANQAAKMANRLVVLADEHKAEVVKNNIAAAANAAQKSFIEKEKTVATMTDSLESLRRAGESVWNLGEERKSGRYQNYELQYRKELERYMELKLRFEELNDLQNSALPASYVASAAVVARKPVYPKKLLISLVAGLVAAALYTVFIKLKNS